MMKFNQSKKNDITFEGEAVRLYNELKTKPARFYINLNGVRVDVAEKKGIDLNKSTFLQIVNWLADTRFKKSQSSIAFVHRFLSINFNSEYAQHRHKIDNRFKMEYELIQSNSKKEVQWLGEVGFQNMVRLDNSLTNNKSQIRKNKDNTISIVKKI